MQRNRGNGDPFSNFGDPFAGFGGFGGFGGQRSMLSNFFGGRDPFDDPFFQRPFGGMLGSSMFGPSMFGPSMDPFAAGQTSGFIEHQAPQPARSRGPIIEELSSDDEGEQGGEKKHNPRKHGRSSEGPYVEDPDDVTEGRRSKQVQYMNNYNMVNSSHSQPQTHSYSFQSSTVSYGGTDGAYYTSSRTRRTGSDGLTFEEAKEADTASGQASHRISRGMHEKGHTVNRKLNSDGKVDTMQMLHNLNEDELSGFDEAWNGRAKKHLPGWNKGFAVNGGEQIEAGTRGGWALPSTEQVQHSRNMRSNVNEIAGTSKLQHIGRTKAGPGDGPTFSQSRGRSATAFNKDQTRRH